MTIDKKRAGKASWKASYTHSTVITWKQLQRKIREGKKSPDYIRLDVLGLKEHPDEQQD